jgi:hypothetical protein
MAPLRFHRERPDGFKFGSVTRYARVSADGMSADSPLQETGDFIVAIEPRAGSRLKLLMPGNGGFSHTIFLDAGGKGARPQTHSGCPGGEYTLEVADDLSCRVRGPQTDEVLRLPDGSGSGTAWLGVYLFKMGSVKILEASGGVVPPSAPGLSSSERRHPPQPSRRPSGSIARGLTGSSLEASLGTHGSLQMGCPQTRLCRNLATSSSPSSLVQDPD